MDLEKFANIFGAETVKKIYEDGLSESVQEAGKVLTDIIKTFRLFTAPIQLTATFQDRLVKYLDKVRNSVPEENQIPAQPSLAGPIIDRLKYLEENNYLTDLYLNLLARSINKERVNEAHPAFIHIIDQLSPDEAYFLYRLKDKSLEFTSYRDFDNQTRTFSNYRRTKAELAAKEFTFPDHFDMYYQHLESLNLTRWPVYNEEFPKNEAGIQIGFIEHSRLSLTKFGELFVNACIPEEGFILIKNKP